MIRTDLATERRETLGEDVPGLEVSRKQCRGFAVETVRVLDRRGEEAIGRPRGRYVTLELGSLIRREDGAFQRGAEALAAELRALLPDGGGCVLVAGLGNRSITPDAVGPNAVRWTLATRHLKGGAGTDFPALRPVAAVAPGVLGDTGLESAEFVAALCRKLQPDCVVAVDALASRSVKRLCRTVQLTDTGIVPGSGVGNRRQGLDRALLGCPVIAVGVPTVVDARTLAADLCGLEQPPADADAEGLIVTPREIDAQAADIGRLVGCAVSLALQPSLTLEDLEMLLS